MNPILPEISEDTQVFEASLRDISQRISLIVEKVSEGKLAVVTGWGKVMALLTNLDSQSVIIRDGLPVAVESRVDGKLARTEVDALTMREIGLHSGLVKKRASQRKPIVITKHGMPVALLTYVSQEAFDAAFKKALLEMLLPPA